RVGQSRRGARYSAWGHLPSRWAPYAAPQRAHGGTGWFHWDMGCHGWIISFTAVLVSSGSSAHRPSLTGPLPLTELRPSASAVTWVCRGAGDQPQARTYQPGNCPQRNRRHPGSGRAAGPLLSVSGRGDYSRVSDRVMAHPRITPGVSAETRTAA